MKYSNRSRRVVLYSALLLVFFALSLCARAQWSGQSGILGPGWNSVYLWGTPYPSNCDELFGQESRILSVRRWCPLSREQMLFDESAGVVLPEGGSWLTWFPTNHPHRAMLDLIEATGPAAYLVEVSDGPPLTFVVKLRPQLINHTWMPGVHQFVGFPVFGGDVTFSKFFAPVTDSIPVEFHGGAELYQVTSGGEHTRIFQPALTAIRPGVAYWVASAKRAEYAGPLQVTLDGAEAWMDFGDRLLPRRLTVKNLTEAPRLVQFYHAISNPAPPGEEPVAGRVPLKFAVVTALGDVQGRNYTAFPLNWSTQLQAKASVELALLPDAWQLSGVAGVSYQSILRINDLVEGTSVELQSLGVRVAATAGSVEDPSGLWVGEATIEKVGRLEMLGVYGSIPVDARPVSRPYRFRLLVHVDSNRVARVLQRAMICTRPDEADGGVMAELLADEADVAAYRVAHPGARVFRVSSANFPFMDPAELSGGGFGVPYQVQRTVVEVPRDDPLNPFRHQYAPLHDNLEQRAENRVPYDEDVEVFSVRRHVELIFQPPDEQNPDPRWGGTVCGGIYKEEILGLGGTTTESNRMIKVEGTFRLERAVDAGAFSL